MDELVQSSAKVIFNAESDSKINESELALSTLIDELTSNLCTCASYKINAYNGQILFNYKYIDSARRNLFRIKITLDPSIVIFEIDRSDLEPKIILELTQLDYDTQNKVITEAVARVYESIDYQYFHKNVIRSRIRWELI